MIMQKLTTIVRGSVRESAEHIIDANAIRIFEQEIHDCEMAIRKAKANLTVVVAEKIKLQRQIQQTTEQIQKREAQAIEALNKQLDDLPVELASLIADDETLLEELSRHMQGIQQQERDLGQQLKSAIQQIKHYRRELELAKTTQKSQQACRQLQTHNADISSAGSQLQDSLERIKNQQQGMADRMTASKQVSEQLDNNGIEQRLKQHGIGETNHSSAVLERLKQAAEKTA